MFLPFPLVVLPGQVYLDGQRSTQHKGGEFGGQGGAILCVHHVQPPR